MSDSKVPFIPTAESLETSQRLRLNVDRLRRLVRAVSADSMLGRTQEAVLSQIRRRGPQSTADLAKGENIRPQSMGAVVAELVSLALVTKSPDPADRRRELISLTPAGEAEMARTAVLRDLDLARLFDAHLDGAERACIAEAMVIIENLALKVNPEEGK